MSDLQLPGQLRLFAPAKLNLGLEVLGKREDGYHEIVTLLETVSIFDVIDLTPAAGLEVLSPLGIAEESDLVWLALKRLAERIGSEMPVQVRIQKRIPIAAGLGGGSSDAGAVLRAFQLLLGLNPESVREIARSLGSDVPFFLEGGVALAAGTGTDLTPVASAGRRWFVIVVPKLEIPAKTTKMYRSLKTDDFSDGSGTQKLASTLTSGYRLPSSLPTNAFHRVLREYEPFQAAAEALENAGACSVVPTGAGPALYTICESFEAAKHVASRVLRGPYEVHLATSIDPRVNDSRLQSVTRG